MKKFIISSANLKPALKKLALAVKDNDVLPAITNIYCKVNKGEIELITSDRELTISIKLDAESADSFEVLVPFDFLNKIIGLIKDQPIVFEHPSTRKARIVCDEDVFELNSLDKFEDYPKLPSVPKKNSMQLAKSFVDILSKAMLTVGKDSTRSELTVACLDIGTKNSTLASTDANSFYTHTMEVSSGQKDQLLITQNLASALKGMGDMELTWTDKQMCFSSGRIIVWCTRLDLKYPNYKKVIPDYDANLELQRDQLVAALNKVCLSNDSLKTTQIELKKTPDYILLHANDEKYERKIHARIPGKFTGNLDTLFINAARLLTIMDQINVEKLRLHINEAGSPILITSEEEKEYKGVLVPLKMNQ